MSRGTCALILTSKIPASATRFTEALKQRERERENSNSKTLFYKDCSIGSFKNLSNNEREREREIEFPLPFTKLDELSLCRDFCFC